MTKVNGAAGPLQPSDLGMTLMHEHVTLKFLGSDTDTLTPSPARSEIMAAALDWVAHLRSRGIRTIVDPAPSDMGRDLELSAELSARTGLNIVCATGVFNEQYGATQYWNHKRGHLMRLGRLEDFHRYLADVFINEIENGAGPEKIRCGIIKVASGSKQITEYERDVLKAAALASNDTGCPITTHSDDGHLGADQQAVLTAFGVPPHRIVIGHSCNTNDHAYHRHVVEHGSYIGFDRFGFQVANTDENRMDALAALLRTGALESIVISNDACFCWAQNMEPAALREHREDERTASWNPLRVTDYIIPELKKRGVTETELETLMVDNPRRYFSQERPPACATAQAVSAATA